MSELITKMNFEIFVLDTSDNYIMKFIKSEGDLLYWFLAYGELWEHPSLDQENFTITDTKATLTIKKVQCDIEEADNAFLINVTGDYEWLEEKRVKILRFLQSQGFKNNDLYIFVDQVSEQISTKLYPLIYQLENALRSYLTKFMITKVGLNWWKNLDTNKKLNDKVRNRKNNEEVFSQFIDNKLYLIDFPDLGELIYTHSTGLIKQPEILDKIQKMEETTEAIQDLKKELDHIFQSNYKKFFSKHFKENNFQQKWEEMKKLRIKVAHNNLFTTDDRTRGETLCHELIEIINKATIEVDNLILQPAEKEAIKNDFKNVDNWVLKIFKVVSEETQELESYQVFNVIQVNQTRLYEAIDQLKNFIHSTDLPDSEKKEMQQRSDEFFNKVLNLISLLLLRLGNSKNIVNSELEETEQQFEEFREFIESFNVVESEKEEIKKQLEKLHKLVIMIVGLARKYNLLRKRL